MTDSKREFKKSSFCSKGKCCVDVAIGSHLVLVRNSEKHEKTIHFSIDEWRDFIAGVKDGEFDIIMN